MLPTFLPLLAHGVMPNITPRDWLFCGDICCSPILLAMLIACTWGCCKAHHYVGIVLGPPFIVFGTFALAYIALGYTQVPFSWLDLLPPALCILIGVGCFVGARLSYLRRLRSIPRICPKCQFSSPHNYYNCLSCGHDF